MPRTLIHPSWSFHGGATGPWPQPQALVSPTAPWSHLQPLASAKGVSHLQPLTTLIHVSAFSVPQPKVSESGRTHISCWISF